MIVTDSNIVDNRAQLQGAGIDNYGSVQMQRGQVENNAVLGQAGKGGGIYNNDGTAMFQDVSIQRNQALTKGAGFYVFSGFVSLNNCTE
jgi:hypothetical protein